jgi:sulfite exporter TauE/SafE
LAAGLLASKFLLGLASGVHCLGMCGGIAGAFSARPVLLREKSFFWKRQLAFNLGRISSYAAAGAAAGALGSAGAWMAGAGSAQAALLVAANLLLILAGIHLSGLAAPLARLETLGLPLWRRVQPVAARLASAPTLPGAFGAGVAWGFLPCGLVYAALAAAVFAASSVLGAAAMLAYGLGTLPWLLGAGYLALRLRDASRLLRRVLGAAVAGFGVWGLVHSNALADGLRDALLCL